MVSGEHFPNKTNPLMNSAVKTMRPEEILGVETPEDFSADPLGVETRLFRAL